MTLFWCLGGIATAFCIGRYNQSNKLFWILFTSFILGIAGAAVYNKCTVSQNETRSAQVLPTQDSASTRVFVTLEEEDASCTPMPALVSQELTPEHHGSKSFWTQWVIRPLVPPPNKT